MLLNFANNVHIIGHLTWHTDYHSHRSVSCVVICKVVVVHNWKLTDRRVIALPSVTSYDGLSLYRLLLYYTVLHWGRLYEQHLDYIHLFSNYTLHFIFVYIIKPSFLFRQGCEWTFGLTLKIQFAAHRLQSRPIAYRIAAFVYSAQYFRRSSWLTCSNWLMGVSV